MNESKNPNDLLDFMSKNFNYGYLGKNGRVYYYNDSDFEKDWFQQYILQNSKDLLKNRCGNCWDQVEFERDWFKKKGYEIKTIYEMVKLNYDNVYPTHSFLVYKNNNYWYLFENADFDNRGIYKFNSFDELLSYQYNKYVELLKSFNITDDEIKRIIITDFVKPKEHISAEEYLKHVINSKLVAFNKKMKVVNSNE